MTEIKTINAQTLRNWLEVGHPLSILDIRPIHQRMEVPMPYSFPIDAYDKLKMNDPETFKYLHLDKNVPIITCCTGGNLSKTAAQILTQQGYEVYSLEGGLNAWNNK